MKLQNIFVATIRERPYSIGIRELKNRLTQTLRLSRSGIIVTVTDRGRPIARIVPIAGEAPVYQEALASMAREGLVSLPRQPLRPNPVQDRIRGKSLADTIIAERG